MIFMRRFFYFFLLNMTAALMPALAQAPDKTDAQGNPHAQFRADLRSALSDKPRSGEALQGREPRRLSEQEHAELRNQLRRQLTANTAPKPRENARP